MTSIFDKTTRSELIDRINSLDENNPAQWGKMSVFQMVKHCRLFEEMILGKTQYKRGFIGLLFGKMALKQNLKDEMPLRRNTPTLPEFIIKEDGNLAAEKTKWLALMDEYEHFSNHDFVHPFFGKMTKEQVGYLAYKHTDHHLRQFNC
jgi:hypothetical protein